MLSVSFIGGYGLSFSYLVWGSLFQGSNLVVSALISVVIFLFFGMTYTMLSMSMPRSGGEYVFLSRILGPFPGFVGSFWFFFLLSTWLGSAPAWLMSDGIRPLLWVLAQSTGNEGLTAVSSLLSTKEAIVAVSIVVIVVIALISLQSTRVLMRIVWVLFFTGLVGLLAYFGLALTRGGANFVANFDSYSGTTVANVIKAANEAGFQTSGFSSYGTIMGIIYTGLSFTGFQYVVYVAGEVKESQKSILYATFGGLLIFATVAILTYQISYQAFGIEVIRSLSYLFATGNSAYPLSYGPYPQVLVVFLTKNPFLVLLVFWNWIATIFMPMLTGFVACQRGLFAWAFDRILPDKVSAVDSRKGTPYVAALATAVIAVMSMFLYVYTPLFQYFTYLTVAWMIVYIFVGLAAFLLPYRRKDIFDVSPPWTRRRIGNVPLVSVFGIVSMVLAFALGVISLLPAYTGAPINPLYISLIPAVFTMAIAIYGISYFANKSRGINLSMIFREIPPE
jgi:amino acid transporter